MHEKDMKVFREMASKPGEMGQLIQAVSPIVFMSQSASLGPNCAELLERGIINDSDALLPASELQELLAAKLIAATDLRQDDSEDDPVEYDSEKFNALVASYVKDLKLKKAKPDYNFAYASLDAFPVGDTERAALAAALISVSHSLGRTVLPLWESLALFQQVKDED
jgi:hypothetical protein